MDIYDAITIISIIMFFCGVIITSVTLFKVDKVVLIIYLWQIYIV